MTSPGGGVPEGGFSVSSLSDLQALDEAAIRHRLLDPVGRAWDGVQDSFLARLDRWGQEKIVKPLLEVFRGARPRGWEGVADAFVDGQLELQSRLDLLDGLRGYCSAYQSVNINSEWSSGDGRIRVLPFTSQVGPSKGARIDSARMGIVFDEPGAWMVFVQAKPDRTGWLKGPGETDGSSITLKFFTPEGGLYSKATVASPSGTDEDGLMLVRTLVVPRAGFYCNVECWSSRWRWWLGGTEFSALSTYKLDSRVSNAGQSTVPNEASR